MVDVQKPFGKLPSSVLKWTRIEGKVKLPCLVELFYLTHLFTFRPSFRLLERWLQTISTHWRISRSLNIPNELLNEICSFTGFHRKIVEESSD